MTDATTSKTRSTRRGKAAPPRARKPGVPGRAPPKDPKRQLRAVPGWPVVMACGIETAFCPECRDAEPDGLPNLEAFETFEVVCCDACATHLFEQQAAA